MASLILPGLWGCAIVSVCDAIAVIFSKQDRAGRSLGHLMSPEMLAAELPMAAAGS